MNSLLEFFSFSDPNVRYVAFGTVLLTASAAMVGCFTFLNKKALVGDAIAHAVLPGVCLGFILSGTKNPVFLVTGAFLTGWLSMIAVNFITTRTRIKEDTTIALTLSVFFGIGILMLTSIQNSGNAAQAGLDNFLFGKAAALVGTDLISFGAIAVVLVVGVLLFFKEFTLLVFDRQYAISMGLPVRKLELLLTSFVVLAVVIGIQAVGVVLMAAILITPAAAARFWTDRVRLMLFLASVFGVISGLAGAYVSYVAPAMPTGPWIVVVMSLIAFLSFFLAPKRGVVSRMWRRRAIDRLINDENVLKVMYQLAEDNQGFKTMRSIPEIVRRRSFHVPTLKKVLRRLHHQGYLDRTGSLFSLSEPGRIRAQRIVKVHRLWELYLTTHLNLAADHVHEDAETIEHLLTPELEEELERQLAYPEVDPHQARIPYQ